MQSQSQLQRSKFMNTNKHVQIRICFLLLGDIDTKTQTFEAEVLIEASWQCHSAINDGYDPLLVLTNLETLKKESVWYTREERRYRGEKSCSTHVTMHWRLRGVFFENMELQDFPRDVQDISIHVSSEWGAADIELILNESRMSTLDFANFRDDQEWFLFRHVEMEKVPEDPASPVQLGYTAGYIVAKCRVARRMKFYMLNHVLIMFSLILLSFTLFTFDAVWNLYRIGSSMTLLLVAVTFKLSVAGTLPTISYLTYLDKYILFGMVYLCVLCVIFAAITPWKDEPITAQHIDKHLIFWTASLVLLFHVWYALHFVRQTDLKINLMKAKDVTYAKNLLQARQRQRTGSSNRHYSCEGSSPKF